MEYRIINYGLDDDLQREVNAMAERGWERFLKIMDLTYNLY